MLVAQEYSSRVSKDYRKRHGQFFTPPEIARFMVASLDKRPRRVLDPAAGSGVLLCALIDQLVAKRCFGELHADAYEVDPALVPLLRNSLSRAKEVMPGFSFAIHEEDFVEAFAGRHRSLFAGRSAEYDLVVANPPYFKVRADSRTATMAKACGAQGRTNIYSLMMAAAANLLGADGHMVFIVPRSFCNGFYFRHFRRQLLACLSLDRVHVFESRRAAFRPDDVLQENIIVWLRKGRQANEVLVSSSKGVADIAGAHARNFASTDVIADTAMIQLPTSAEEQAVLDAVRTWPHRLHSFHLEISTGPVVAYRSAGWIASEQGSYPLLLLDNVRMMRVEWPLKNSKPQYVRDCPSARKWLVPNGNYVLLRRFSAKEEPRRLLAAALLEDQCDADQLGIENHVNFIHRPRGRLTAEEALGLAALLNSELLDSYFRIINGNTQVNATDLRILPLPPLDTIAEIGSAIRRGADWQAVTEETLSRSGQEIQQEAPRGQT